MAAPKTRQQTCRPKDRGQYCETRQAEKPGAILSYRRGGNPIAASTHPGPTAGDKERLMDRSPTDSDFLIDPGLRSADPGLMAIIGIDLGTSNSAAAALRGGRPILISSAEGVTLGGKAFPSYVALTADGQVTIGEPARRQLAANPEGTVTAFKRRMGRREKVRLRDREFSPEQLSAFLLQKIKRDAEAFLGESVDKAVITVPAYFDDNQRSATKDAGRIAGIALSHMSNIP